MTPIPKGILSALVCNYRPISITPVLSKVFERFISLHFGRFLQRSGILPSHQYSYRKNLGACDALLDIVCAGQIEFDRGGELALVQIDFSTGLIMGALRLTLSRRLGVYVPAYVPFYKLNTNWILCPKSHLTARIYFFMCESGYAYWDKMSRFSIKCVHCRVVALSCCWDMTSHLCLTFVSPSSISMRYYQRIVIDEKFSNLKMELYFWNRLTKYHYGLIVCIQCYCYSFYIKYHISASNVPQVGH